MDIHRWHFDDSGYYAYLLVDCTEPDLSELKALLKERGYSVMHSGKSFQPASDGRQYAFFIRLGQPSGAQLVKPAKDAVVQTLKSGQALSLAAAPDTALRDISDVLEELGSLKESVGSLTSMIRDLVQRTELQTAHAAKFDEALGAEQKRISAQLREVRKQIIDSILSGLDRRLGDDERTARLQENVEALLQSEQEWFRLNEDLKRECNAQTQRVQELERELEVARSTPPAASARSNTRALVALLESCFPTLRLIRSCGEVLFVEFADYTPALRKISGLILQPETVKGTTVKGTDGWHELKFGTGVGNYNGRLYYRRNSAEVQVLVSVKQVQEDDFRYLRNHT